MNARVPTPSTLAAASGVRLTAAVTSEQAEVLTPEALALVADLERAFRGRRRDLLAARRARQARFDAGELPDFLAATRALRESRWRVGPIPADLVQRKVEITGPVERKMIVNALNSGADVFMADFEDSNAPTWANVVDGQVHLRDALRRRIDFVHPESGKRYALTERSATLMVRPRGWHLDERHVEVDGEPASGALVDFALFLFHNARLLVERGSGPYYYLPKLEGHLEARLWRDVFRHAEQALGLARATIKATVLIETLPAAFEMDEILFELREHVVGLNCGRWDYIFSFLKTFRERSDCVLPDRATVGMERPFLAAYAELLVRTCHRRGAFAMGGMAAQIPIKNDPARNAAALALVRADKRREARAGHDGTWVAHPGLVALARAELDAHFAGPNQLDVPGTTRPIGRAELLAVPRGPITAAGLRHDLSVGVRYLAAWLDGQGCVPIDGLMEDAATAEISRALVWHWVRHGALLDDGRRVDLALVRAALAEVLAGLRREAPAAARSADRIALAGALFDDLLAARELPDFLTLTAYAHL